MMKTLLMATLCHRGWRPAGTISDLQSATAILFFAVASALLKCGGQLGSTNHSGRTAMESSFHRGWLVSNVCSVAMFFFLNSSSWNSFALWGSWRPDCEHWTVSLSNSDFLLLRACASLCVFSIVRCVYIICFVVASFALWFCDCAILLSIALRDNDIKIQRRHIKLEKDELERQLATNDPAWVCTCLPLVSHLSSTLVSHSGCLGRHEFTLVSHLSPTLGSLGCMSLHLSPTLVSHSGCLGPHDFTLVSHLSLTLGCLGPHEFTLVFHLSPALVFHSGCLGPHDFTLVSHLSLTLGCLGPHDFTLVFHLSPTLVFHSGCLGPHEFTLVSHTCLPHLSPTLGALGRMSLHLSSTCLPHLSPTLGILGRMILHLSPTCFPHVFPTLDVWERMSLYTLFPLVSHTCLPHLSATLGSLGRMSLHLSPPCLPHLSPTLGDLGRMILHLSPTCFPHVSPTLDVWKRMSLHLSSTCLPTLVFHSGCLGSHNFHTCLPLVSHTCLSRLSPTLVSHTCLPLWLPWSAWVYTCLPLVSRTCLSLWVPWAAWFYTCLPLVPHTWVPWAA